LRSKSNVTGIKLRRYVLSMAIVWIFAGLFALFWIVYKAYSDSYDTSLVMAKAGFERDLIYRLWNATHGGVYVNVKEGTKPNPYLDVPHRDIETTAGKKLTLINPAYMTRQAHELGKERYNLLGHITSLNPIRPENKADPWEEKALELIAGGVKEYPEITELNGKRYMRYMGALITRKGCLKCHEKQGYKVGDIRGGISVSVPMAHFDNVRIFSIVRVAGIGFVFWIVSLFVLFAGSGRLRKEIEARELMQKELVDISRRAGMAEVATSVLHNIGNGINNVNISSSIISEKLGSSKVEDILLVAGMVEEHIDDIEDFLKNDTKGKNILPYLKELGEMLEKERAAMMEESDVLCKSVDHIKEIIRWQQSNASVKDSVSERVVPADLLDEAMVISQSSIQRHKIEVKFNTPELRPISLEKFKIIQVITNIVSNAINSVNKLPEDRKKLIEITVAEKEPERLFISIKDSGVGILKENIDKIFQYGFTTGDEGRGFGLHSASLTVKEMGGELIAFSEGEGKGAEFTITLPYDGEKA